MKMNKYPRTYYVLLIVVLLLSLIPKQLSTILKIIPTRVLLIFLLLCVYLFDIYKKNIIINYKKNSKWFLLLLFVVGISFSILKTPNTVLTLYTIVKFLSYIILAYIMLSIKFDERQKEVFIKIIFLSALIILIYGLFQYLFKIDLIVYGIYKYPGAIGRVATTFFNPIYYGVYLNVIILMILFVLTNGNTKSKIERYCLYFLYILAVVNLIFTFTRSAYLIFFINLFLLIILNFKRLKSYLKKTWIIYIISTMLFITIPGASSALFSGIDHILPKFILNVIDTNNDTIDTNNDTVDTNNDTVDTNNDNVDANNDTVDTNNDIVDIDNDAETEHSNDSSESIIDYSINDRGEFRRIVLKVIENNKLFGVGLGSYEDYVKIEANYKKYVNYKFGYPHNFYLHIFAETGLVGFIPTLLLLATIFFLLLRRLFVKTKNINPNIFAFILTLDILLICMFESLLYDSQITPILVLVICFLYNSNEQKDCENRVMFISSVGGHLTQILQLNDIYNNYNYVLITEDTSTSKGLTSKYNVEFLKYGSRQYLIEYLFIFSFNIIKSFYLFLVYFPKVLVTTGTHTAVPMCYIGKMFGCKIIFIESFAKIKTPTLSGKLVYPIADTFVVQWKQMKKHYPKAIYWGRIY